MCAMTRPPGSPARHHQQDLARTREHIGEVLGGRRADDRAALAGGEGLGLGGIEVVTGHRIPAALDVAREVAAHTPSPTTPMSHVIASPTRAVLSTVGAGMRDVAGLRRHGRDEWGAPGPAGRPAADVSR